MYRGRRSMQDVIPLESTSKEGMDVSKLNKTLYAMGVIGLIITMFIVYKNTKNVFAVRFVIGYLIFIFSLAFQFLSITILRMRELKWVEFRKRILNFVRLSFLNSIFVFILVFAFDYFFKTSKLSFVKVLYTSVSLAFGVSFLDLVFLSKKNS